MCVSDGGLLYYRELPAHLVLMVPLVMLVTLVTKATQDHLAKMVMTDQT